MTYFEREITNFRHTEGKLTFVHGYEKERCQDPSDQKVILYLNEDRYSEHPLNEGYSQAQIEHAILSDIKRWREQKNNVDEIHRDLEDLEARIEPEERKFE